MIDPDPLALTVTAPLDEGEAAGSTAASSLAPAADGPAVLSGRYELLCLLGSGAMGTVYRARDRELDDVVALKVLKKELAAAPGMLERFKREVKLARRVTHKNVARTFDIGEHEGDRFLTMEFVDGEMLGRRLARVARLSVGEASRIARDVCAGLAAAHAAGVLHRDLKPENVIVSKDGVAVITDFGIARALSEDEAGKTAAGAFVGTPAYMAPEQVEGAGDLDARADLYALGAMLFELLTGRAAWAGQSAIAVAAARLLKPPPDPRSLVPDLPEPVAALVMKLLARSRDERFASAGEAEEALGALGVLDESLPTPTTTTTSGAPPGARAARADAVASVSLAVLPLLNLGPEEDAYLGQTVTEDLVDALSVVPELRVRPRGDTARHVQASRDVREIGRTLGVDVVVDGSIRRVGDRVRVSTRLITIADGFQLWAKRFEQPTAELPAVSDAAVAAITRALTARAVDPLAAAAPIDTVAQDLYRQGRYELRTPWHGGTHAIRMLREAHARAPEDARIAGTLAIALARRVGLDAEPAETSREARRLIDETLRLEPKQPETRAARGLLHFYAGEIVAAVLDLRDALGAAPNQIDALEVLGRTLIEVGRVEEGLAMLTRVLAIEPDFFLPRVQLARTMALMGDHEKFLEVLGSMPPKPIDPSPYLIALARDAIWRGDATVGPRLEEALRSGAAVTRHMAKSIETLALIVSSRGSHPGCEAAIDLRMPILEGASTRWLAFTGQLRAELFLACGAQDRAIEMLEMADANGLLDLVWLDRCPLFDAVRARPGFARVRANTALRARRVLEALER